jgi:hypothetical protein
MWELVMAAMGMSTGWIVKEAMVEGAVVILITKVIIVARFQSGD